MKILQSNRRNLWKYRIYYSYKAGLVLEGEIVSGILRGNISLVNSYIRVVNGELFLIQLERLQCKLLLKKLEILRIMNLIKKEQFVCIPGIFFLNNRKIKLEFYLGKYNREAVKKKFKKGERKSHLLDRIERENA